MVFWMDMSASIILLLFIVITGSTVQSVIAVDINPVAASNPCLNIYNETQLSLLISIVIESQNAVMLHSEPIDGRVLPGEEVSFLCCALVLGTGWSPLGWIINPEPSPNLFHRGYSRSFPVSSMPVISLLNRTMRVNGSMDVNGTEIKCYADGNSDSYISDPRVLIVLGKSIDV